MFGNKLQSNDVLIEEKYRQKYLKYKNKYLQLKLQLGGEFKNACVALFYNNQIYLVQEKDGRWNIPGGGIKTGENSFQAAFREFKEETGGFDLKRWADSTNPRRKFEVYEYHGHTKIWWHVSSENPRIKFKSNNETIADQWAPINNLPHLKFPASIKSLIDNLKSLKKLH